MINITQSSSTRPYLVRALHEWCADNGFTPYVAVSVDDSVQVPREYVNNGEIVLNISFDATSHLQLTNEFIVFKARFGGVAREISVPMGRVIAIYAKENGQGMAFPAPVDADIGPVSVDKTQPEPEPPTPSGGGTTRPQLKRVK
jgi:stringent starvation protein B